MARGQRRHLDWNGFQISKVNLSTTQAVLGSGLTDVEPVTLQRIRGEVFIKGTPDLAADDELVGLGMIVVQQQAATAGGASVPSPLADLSAPWLWHRFVPLSAGSAGLLGDDLGSMVRVEVDSKAQRKVGINEIVIFVGEIQTGEYATVAINGGIRGLAMHS